MKIDNERIRSMFDAERLHHALIARKRRAFQADGFRPAAVLLPIQLIESRDHLMFTRRTDTVEHHKGQISFPGGRLDDGEDLYHCALRETHEEVGIHPKDVQVLGALDDIWTPTRYVVTPFVGIVPHPYELKISEAEIEEIIYVPIEELLDPAIYEETQIEYEGKKAVVPYYHWGDRIIWGATGRILRQFLALAFPGEAKPCEES